MNKKKSPKSHSMSPAEWRHFLDVLLGDERVRGDIILLSIGMESNLNLFLEGYFVYRCKGRDFSNLILTKLTASQKISVFKELKFRASVKSFPALVKTCTGLNRLRNHCAHASWIDRARVDKLADDEFVRSFMAHYPSCIDKTREHILRLFAALRKTQEYKRTEFPESDDDIPF